MTRAAWHGVWRTRSWSGLGATGENTSEGLTSQRKLNPIVGFRRGGGGGGGGKSMAAYWEDTYETLLLWKASLLSGLSGDLPADCLNALKTLDALTPRTQTGPITTNTITSALENAVFENEVGSTDLYMNLLPYKSARSKSMASYTVGQSFKNDPGQSALAGLGVGVIYFRPGGSYSSATIMHELLHNLGLEDGDIMGALGLKGPTVEITRFLWDTCFKPPVYLLP